jgi:hypothetical protein
VFGAGTASCGEWTQVRLARPSNTGTQWVAGYLSGLNIAAPAQARDALSTTDFDGVMGWIDNHYRSNPLDPIIIAADKLKGVPGEWQIYAVER